MGCRGASAPGIVAPVHGQVHGVVPSLSMRTLPPGSRRCRRWPDRPRGRGRALHRDLLLAFAAVAIERIERSRIGAGELVRRLGKFAELRGLWPVVGSHAMARTHMISNQHTSPIALAKSTAIGPKAMTYRNGFMRIPSP